MTVISSSMSQLKFSEILPWQFTAPLTLLSVKIIRNVSPEHGSLLLNFLSKELPLPLDLNHLKRIRRGPINICSGVEFRELKSTGSLDVIFNTEPELKERLSSLTTKLEQLTGTSLEFDLVDVPRFPPVTKEQFSEWNKVWPLSFKRVAFDPREIKLNIPDEIRLKYSNMSLNQNQCLIVSPGPQFQLLTSNGSGDFLNPLEHCVMKSLECVATLQLEQDLAASKRLKVENFSELAPTIADALAECLPEYLCTGCFVFCPVEPCVMCGMALVHSRVAAVFFSRKDPSFGAFSGKIQLHTTQEINHKFRVFCYE